MSGAVAYQRVKEQLEGLKMMAALSELDGVLERGQKEEFTPVEVIDTLLEREVSSRFERRMRTNIQLSGIHVQKRIEDFDFESQPQVPKRTIEELATLRFLAAGENVLFLGPCGVGKTHLATGLALKALEQGHRAYFLTLHDLITKAQSGRKQGRLGSVMSVILRADLFILDELGFLPLAAEDATFLFEIVNKRYQANKSTIVTSNKSYGQWGEIFPDPVLAVALLDRLLHHATAVNIRGESYRLKQRREAGLT
jgi:DNA replication protein DnaC